MISTMPTIVLAVAGMIEEGAVAFLHLHQIQLGLVIAHAGPGLALGALLDLLVPRPAAGLGFHQPDTPSFKLSA